ncbi:hypothetical protein NUW54_g6853 [Trametes sanguinea]|uniref:Uncharacterized protein n=1 Tax=Trametes sanguinea TaxID=158606 RepID=A0ACC1PR55_9APHY|nr:hypothetical protein NUW54_g6853 [Trametes sanguinea]
MGMVCGSDVEQSEAHPLETDAGAQDAPDPSRPLKPGVPRALQADSICAYGPTNGTQESDATMVTALHLVALLDQPSTGITRVHCGLAIQGKGLANSRGDAYIPTVWPIQSRANPPSRASSSSITMLIIIIIVVSSSQTSRSTAEQAS